MTVYGISHECMRSEATGSLQVEMKHVATVRLRMDHKFAYGNCSCTTFGT